MKRVLILSPELELLKSCGISPPPGLLTSILPSTKVSQDQRIHILSTKKEQNHSLDRLDKRRAIGRLIVQWIICTVMLLVATYAFLYAALLAERRVKSAERGMAICVKSIVYPSNHRIP
jgi:hypothetical protein